MDRFIEKQLKKLEKQENRFLKQTGDSMAKTAMESIEKKIPDKIKENLEYAFYQAFQVILIKGSPVIEKTYNKEKIQTEYEIREYRFGKNQKKRALKDFQSASARGKLTGLGAAAAEGAVLGVLGIGLPDIKYKKRYLQIKSLSGTAEG